MTLDPIQLRVLGALIEKEITTPENYPLSLNSLISACNQRSSRDPVLDLTEDEVRQAVHSLEDMEIVSPVRDARVPKYEHRIRTILNLRRDETAILCLLLLRGPQTAGELRGRADRMYSFDDIAAVQATLERLANRANAAASDSSPTHNMALAVQLPRQPGSRESRYAHLLGGPVAAAPAQSTSAVHSPDCNNLDRSYVTCCMRPSLFAFPGISLLLVLLTSCSSKSDTTTVTAPAVANMWVVAWGASPENATTTSANPGGAEQTFRSFFYPTVSGTMERVRFSNYFGTAPVTIGAARLAIAATPPSVDPAHDVALSFGGSPSVTIAPGAEVSSDAVSLTYAFGQKLAVTAYVQGTFASLTQHDSQVITNYNSPVNAGNMSTDTAGTSISQANTEWFLLSGMDVYGQYQGTVAIFGSSTIDGHDSNYGDTNAYPVPNVAIPSQDDDRISDALARTLNAAGFHVGVLNAGILGDVAGPTSGSPSGSPGVDRIGRDVLHQPGIKTVVIDLGQVDLRLNSCGEATEVEASLQNMVAQANAAGVRVILGTIPPASYCTLPTSPNFGPNPANDGGPFAGDINPGPRNPENIQRDMVNAWIKTTGAALPGVVGVADFEAALADPDHPDFLIPTLNAVDNFHPNGAGYQVKSSAIPINAILPQ